MNADDYPLSVDRLSIEDGGFAVYAFDLPGCMSDGETEAEARENGRSAVRDWLDEARRLGRRIPEPKVASFTSNPLADDHMKPMEGAEDVALSAARHHA